MDPALDAVADVEGVTESQDESDPAPGNLTAHHAARSPLLVAHIAAHHLAGCAPGRHAPPSHGPSDQPPSAPGLLGLSSPTLVRRSADAETCIHRPICGCLHRPADTDYPPRSGRERRGAEQREPPGSCGQRCQAGHYSTRA